MCVLKAPVKTGTDDQTLLMDWFRLTETGPVTVKIIFSFSFIFIIESVQQVPKRQLERYAQRLERYAGRRGWNE